MLAGTLWFGRLRLCGGFEKKTYQYEKKKTGSRAWRTSNFAARANPVVVSVATTCSETLSHATSHRLDERCDPFWTQLGPLFFKSLAKIVGRGDVVSPRDVTLHQAPNVLDRLHVRRICALEQQIDGFHLSELGRGVRCVGAELRCPAEYENCHGLTRHQPSARCFRSEPRLRDPPSMLALVGRRLVVRPCQQKKSHRAHAVSSGTALPRRSVPDCQLRTPFGVSAKQDSSRNSVRSQPSSMCKRDHTTRFCLCSCLSA